MLLEPTCTTCPGLRCGNETGRAEGALPRRRGDPKTLMPTRKTCPLSPHQQPLTGRLPAGPSGAAGHRQGSVHVNTANPKGKDPRVCGPVTGVCVQKGRPVAADGPRLSDSRSGLAVGPGAARASQNQVRLPPLIKFHGSGMPPQNPAGHRAMAPACPATLECPSQPAKETVEGSGVA